MTHDRPISQRRDPFDRVLALLIKVQTPLGLLLIVAGFAAVFFGWLEASGTADVRIQLQDLISGGVGGLGMLVIGGVLLQSALADRAARGTEEALARLADALETESTAARAVVQTTVTQGALAPSGSQVLATHASFHLPGCDLLEGRAEEQVQPTSEKRARKRGLNPCRVCLPPAAGT